MFQTILYALFISIVITQFDSYAFAENLERCDDQSININKIKTVKKVAYLRFSPNIKATKIVNKKASEVMHKTEYAQIDPSTKVREVCKRNGWSYVELTDPVWLIETHKGWVPSNVLNEIKISSNGKRIYRENEVNWDKYTKPYKKQVLFAINTFLQDSCREGLDTFSVTQSPSKTTRRNPVFFITCGNPPNARNIFFSKSDIEKKMK